MWQFYFQFLWKPHTIFYNGCTNLHSRQHQFILPSTVNKGSLFSTSLPMSVICVLFDDSHSDRCEVKYHCGFDFHFSDDEILSISQVPIGHLYALHGKTVFSGFRPILQAGCVLFCFLVELYELVIYFGDLSFTGHIICKYFLPFSKLSFHFIDGFLYCDKAFKFDQASFIYFCLCFLCLRRCI